MWRGKHSVSTNLGLRAWLGGTAIHYRDPRPSCSLFASGVPWMLMALVLVSTILYLSLNTEVFNFWMKSAWPFRCCHGFLFCFICLWFLPRHHWEWLKWRSGVLFVCPWCSSYEHIWERPGFEHREALQEALTSVAQLLTGWRIPFLVASGLTLVWWGLNPEPGAF